MDYVRWMVAISCAWSVVDVSTAALFGNLSGTSLPVFGIPITANPLSATGSWWTPTGPGLFAKSNTSLTAKDNSSGSFAISVTNGWQDFTTKAADPGTNISKGFQDLSSKMNLVGNDFAQGWNAFAVKVNASMANTSTGFESLTNAASKGLEDLASKAKGAGLNFTQGFQDFAAKANSSLAAVGANMSRGFESFKEDASGKLESLVAKTNVARENFTQGFQEFAAKANSSLAAVGANMSKGFESFKENASKGLEDLASKAKGAGQNFTQGVQEFVTKANASLTEVGFHMGQNFESFTDTMSKGFEELAAKNNASLYHGLEALAQRLNRSRDVLLREVEKGANSALDFHLAQLRTFSSTTGNRIRLPPIDYRPLLISNPGFTASEGYVQNLASLHKNGQISIGSLEQGYRVQIPMELTDVTIGYDNYQLALFAFRKNGKFSLNVGRNQIEIIFRLVLYPSCSVRVEKLDVLDLTDVTVSLTGMCPICVPIANFILSFVTGFLNRVVTGLVAKPVSLLLNRILSKQPTICRVSVGS